MIGGNEIDVLDLFPARFVYHETVNNHQHYKDKYLPIIQDDLKQNQFLYNSRNIWKCNTTSSFFGNKRKNIQMFESGNFYQDVIWDQIQKLKIELENSIALYKFPKLLELKEIWYNIYENGTYQEYHDHVGSNFSGVYFLLLEEENKTMFKQENLPTISTNKYYLYNTKHIKEGDVIIFPSDLLHCVEPCETNRITISFNLKIIQ